MGDEEEEDENEDEITFQDSILKNRDPTKSTRRTITEAFSATGITPSNNSSTDSLLRQILARLELLKQQHKETERQIQYIIEESETNPDLFIIQQAKISQTETERNAHFLENYFSILKHSQVSYKETKEQKVYFILWKNFNSILFCNVVIFLIFLRFN